LDRMAKPGIVFTKDDLRDLPEDWRDNVLQPDILNSPEGTKLRPPPWQVPKPNWVAEVLSPSTAKRVREAWLVDPKTRTIEVVPGFAAVPEVLFRPAR